MNSNLVLVLVVELKFSLPYLRSMQKLQYICNIKIICTEEVNVYNAIDLGRAQMKECEASWPEGFRQPLKKRVRTMKECKKESTTVAEQFDSGLIFSQKSR